MHLWQAVAVKVDPSRNSENSQNSRRHSKLPNFTTDLECFVVVRVAEETHTEERRTEGTGQINHRQACYGLHGCAISARFRRYSNGLFR